MQQTKHFGLQTIELGQNDSSTTAIFVHGFGADNTDLVPLADEISILPATTHWLFPNGPVGVQLGPHMTGRAWFPLDAKELEQHALSGRPKDYSATLPGGLTTASASLAQLIASFIKPKHRVIVGGFSQGAMMACDAIFTHKLPVQELIIMSGALVAKDRWQAALRAWPERSQLRVFQSHGEWDPLLSFQNAESLRDLLTAENIFVDFHAFRGQHEIPRTIIQKINQFLG